MEKKQAKDIIGKISLQCARYLTNYNFEEDFIYDYIISRILEENLETLCPLPQEKAKKEIIRIILSCFSVSKKDLLEQEFYDDIFLFNANNETIVKDTFFQEVNYKEIDFQSLTTTVQTCFDSLKTSSANNVNAFLLDEIDINLYNALISHPNLLKTLNWRIFERLIADIIEAFGYEVELMQGTKDNGIDVVAIKKVDVFGIHRYLIQAKRWRNNVGVEPVQQLLFKQSDIGATKSCLVTTSNFTRGAWQLAHRYKYTLELKDFEKIHEWLKLASILKSQMNIDDLNCR